MHVVGTAGHVDHGKSTLVRALTGIDPDRLKEEKARQMTIDLGFAWLPLPDGNTVGVIDVPGHRDFIENMLAGVGGIDAVIFVVAADEGVMPQTREHLAIIDLLGIPTGVIALTKIDLAPDPDWIELVQLDLAEVVSQTVLANAPIIPVSARQGKGITALTDALVSVLAARPPAADIGKPRLWVDRVFSVSGFGTVVTGTLLDGTLSLGQEIELLPSRVRGRVRGLQSHNQALETAHPGNRVAVNLAGIDRVEVRRGQLVMLPGQIPPTRYAGVQFRHLPDSPRALRHNTEVKCFVGSAETMATVRLLDSDALAPGATGWLQLELRDALPVRKGDRFVLRYPSPGETIGGGEVIDPAVDQRWRRNRPEVITRLEALARGEPGDLVMQALVAASRPLTVAALVKATGLDLPTVTGALESRFEQGGVIALDSEESGLPPAQRRVIAGEVVTALMERLTRILTGFHKAEPLRAGMRPDALRGQIALDPADFEAVITLALARGVIKLTRNQQVALPGHERQPSKAQRVAIDKLVAAFAAAPYTPPSVKEATEIVGDQVLAALIDNGDLRLVAADVLFAPEVYHEWLEAVRGWLAVEGRANVRMLRDRFSTSRKYALAVLEQLNALGITKRDGDDHVLDSGAWERVT
jgi:selenocysteine-specific elongation factor